MANDMKSQPLSPSHLGHSASVLHLSATFRSRPLALKASKPSWTQSNVRGGAAISTPLELRFSLSTTTLTCATTKFDINTAEENRSFTGFPCVFKIVFYKDSSKRMLPPIPILSDYGLSPDYGFLPAELPLERLPDPYYNKWEAIVANLQGLVLSKRLRGVIDRLPILSTAGLELDSEWRRAYSLLSFMAHGYIWSGDKPAEVCSLFVTVTIRRG